MVKFPQAVCKISCW